MNTPTTKSAKRKMVDTVANSTPAIPHTDRWTGVRYADLHWWVLAPLIVVLMLVAGILVQSFNEREHEEIDFFVRHVNDMATHGLSEGVRQKGEMLGASLQALAHDKILQEAFRRGDRESLLTHTKDLFAKLHDRYNITHFYFTGPDRVNWLRVHQPLRNGDTINRFTTLAAQRSEHMASGIELGPLGTFTLRVVMPWFDKETPSRLLGYCELGMEIDGILRGLLHNVKNSRLIVAIDKRYIRRVGWESGMRMLGRTPDWDHFSNFVLSSQGSDDIPAPVARALRAEINTTSTEPKEIVLDNESYRISVTPLRDAGERIVGQLIIMVNVSRLEHRAHNAIFRGSIVAVGAVLLLCVFFFWLIRRVERQLRNSEAKLADLAIHDGLTGLYNHKTFQLLLEEELLRTMRYEKTVSVILLDIDYFKKVNDVHGHSAGDMVLRTLSELLTAQLRSADSACRYGGEEFTIILPETGTEQAITVAERIRDDIEKHPFALNESSQLFITVSIGVACAPQHALQADKLIGAADEALYEAKAAGRNRVRLFHKTSQAHGDITERHEHRRELSTG